MTRLKKELEKRSIIFEADEIEITLKEIEHNYSSHLVAVTDKFIITVAVYSATEPMFYIYDRFTLELIGEQEVYKDTQFFGTSFNPWHSFIY